MNAVASLAVHLVVGLLLLGLTHPHVGLGAVGVWAVAISSARRVGVQAGFGGTLLLPFFLVTYLWTHRRDVREMIVAFALCAAGAVWAWAVMMSEDRLKVAVVSVLAAVVGGSVWAFCYLGGGAPTVDNFRAARAQSLRQWDTERTVAAVTDEAVKVSDVAADGDAVVALVTVAPGQPPADLEGHLMDRLAGTVHRLTGRNAVSVSVSRTGTAGVFRVRLDTGHPLRETVMWRDL